MFKLENIDRIENVNMEKRLMLTLPVAKSLKDQDDLEKYMPSNHDFVSKTVSESHVIYETTSSESDTGNGINSITIPRELEKHLIVKKINNQTLSVRSIKNGAFSRSTRAEYCYKIMKEEEGEDNNELYKYNESLRSEIDNYIETLRKEFSFDEYYFVESEESKTYLKLGSDSIIATKIINETRLTFLISLKSNIRKGLYIYVEEVPTQLFENYANQSRVSKIMAKKMILQISNGDVHLINISNEEFFYYMGIQQASDISRWRSMEMELNYVLCYEVENQLKLCHALNKGSTEELNLLQHIKDQLMPTIITQFGEKNMKIRKILFIKVHFPGPGFLTKYEYESDVVGSYVCYINNSKNTIKVWIKDAAINNKVFKEKVMHSIIPSNQNEEEKLDEFNEHMEQLQISEELKSGIIFDNNGNIVGRGLYTVQCNESLFKCFLRCGGSLGYKHLNYYIVEKLNGFTIVPIMIGSSNRKVKFRILPTFGNKYTKCIHPDFENEKLIQFCVYWLTNGYSPIFRAWVYEIDDYDYGKPRVELIAIRKNRSGKYVHYDKFIESALKYGVPLPIIFQPCSSSLMNRVNSSVDNENVNDASAIYTNINNFKRVVIRNSRGQYICNKKFLSKATQPNVIFSQNFFDWSTNQTNLSGFYIIFPDEGTVFHYGINKKQVENDNVEGLVKIPSFSEIEFGEDDIVYNPDAEKPKWIGHYVCGEKLGSGSYGKVREGIDSKTLKRVAVKIIKLKFLRKVKGAEARLWNEIQVMKTLSKNHHPNLMEFYSVIHDKTKEKIYMVVEHCSAGSLARIMGLYKNQRMPEPMVWYFFKQIIEGLQEMHSCGVAHRDIKPENILLTPDRCVKLGDFGESKITDLFEGDQITGTAGTPVYQSPQIAMGYETYSGFAADVWSAGVTLFQMLTGKLPFTACNTSECYELIEKGEYDDSKIASKEVRELISLMLTVDEEDRIQIDEIMDHPWFTNDQEVPEESLGDTWRSQSLIPFIRETAGMPQDMGINVMEADQIPSSSDAFSKRDSEKCIIM
mmetsp:Transcript_7792/g.11557  ORF Transcript_7792/g.11557 Transcript_7792/m.11557 type:complete len:1031 (-) Transcript_7792:14-3106(-)